MVPEENQLVTSPIIPKATVPFWQNNEVEPKEIDKLKPPVNCNWHLSSQNLNIEIGVSF